MNKITIVIKANWPAKDADAFVSAIQEMLHADATFTSSKKFAFLASYKIEKAKTKTKTKTKKPA